MSQTILITEQEMCDCVACPGSARWAPRWACGCDEDICPECGCCLLCCECDDDDDPGLGDDEEDWDAPWLDENYPYEPPTGEAPSSEDLMLAEGEDNDLPF